MYLLAYLVYMVLFLFRIMMGLTCTTRTAIACKQFKTLPNEAMTRLCYVEVLHTCSPCTDRKHKQANTFIIINNIT